MPRKQKIILMVLAISTLLSFGIALVVQAEDKIGNTHITFDEKENVNKLTLCVGQKWMSGPEKPFQKIAVRTDDASIASAVFLETAEPNSIDSQITGNSPGVTNVYFDVAIPGVTPKTAIAFEVTVTEKCEEKKSSSTESKKEKTSPVEKTIDATRSWDWPMPTFKSTTSYTGDGPECLLANEDLSLSYDTNLVPSFQKIDEVNYYLQLGENGVWTSWLTGGLLGVRKVNSTDKTVVEARYNSKKNSQFVVRTKKPGVSVVTIETALLPPGAKKFDQKKIQWKTISLAVNVIPTKSEPTPTCTDEVPISQEEPELTPSKCPTASEKSVPSSPSIKNYSVEAPTGLTPLEKQLQKKIYELAKKSSNLPSVCTESMLQRQSKKISRAFYKTPLRTELYASCVDCAQDVVNHIVDALADEQIACFQGTKVGRQEPIFKLALHTVAALGPSCETLNDHWIILDTWFWAGNVPVLPKSFEIFRHRYRVSTFGQWKYENNVDWGADRSQQNLAK